jgi:uncharacterized protein (DUF362 family)
MGAERIEVSRESSMAVYDRLLRNLPPGPLVPFRLPRENAYTVDGRDTVAVVRADERREGIEEALRLMGGVEPLVKGVKGEIVIKPNCNTDDPFPRDTHPDTVRTIVEKLTSAGFPSRRIVLGETSGRGRGLPTRHTLGNLGMLDAAEELGIAVCCFEEDEWVTVKPPTSRAWPDGIKIPRRIHEADRVILAPIMRPHSNARFTISLKLAVGMLDSAGREWLHNGEAFNEKQMELNLAYSADLVIADATKILVDKELTPSKAAKPGIIITSGNRVASDAVCVALMKQHSVDRVSDRPVLSQEQFAICERLGLGSPRLEKMELRSSNLVSDGRFGDLISGIEEELGG